jgi:hypothetical protein
MNTQKLEVIDRLKEYPKLVDDTIKAIESLPDFDFARIHDYTTIPGLIELTIPYDFNLLKQYRKALTLKWKRYGGGLLPTIAVKTVKFIDDNNIRLCIYLDAREEKSTCEFIQVGERTEPIYEIQCN